MVVAARAEEPAIDSAVSGGSPAFTLPPLPYAQDALAPYVSAETMSFHYGKYHRAYVDNLGNKLIAGTLWRGQPLEKMDPIKQMGVEHFLAIQAGQAGE